MHLLKNSSKMKIKNIVISGTNFWNPGDDFVRDGVIRILRKLFEEYTLNFLFYNFNQDFFPQSKFSGIHNMAAAGDLDKYRDFVDAVVIAGLSAGKEIKDLYNWIIENDLLDRVYLIGAGYENTYVDKNISQEPEATIFRNARIITGRTQNKPNFITELGLPYHHINCPAMLSVENVKDIPAKKNIETIGFSIQLPHRVGIVNHCCDASMYKLAAHTLLELLPRYNVEIIAHHKEEYFHFLNLVKGHDIPVFFSSFYQDLFDIYRRYDLVISTRLHACIFANSHGIPGIIINDTDRHTHCAKGFPHLAWINTREKLYHELENICRQDLRQIANDNKEFKENLMQKYLRVLAGPFGVETHSLDSKDTPITHQSSDVYRHSHNKDNLTQQPADKDEITSKLFNSVCTDTNGKRRVLNTISQLTKDHWLERNIETFKAAIDSNASWFETLCFLNWYAANLNPNNYLEIGVRRGRSMAQVLTQSPQTKAYGFDLWIEDYSGTLNPGPNFVISELKNLQVRNLPTLTKGNSHKTLPGFWDNPNNPQQFELILVDGDHSYEGAKKDLEICFAHLAPGGALLFDDIRHPSHPCLKDLWEEYKNKFSDYIFIEHSQGCGTGVAFKPPFDKLRMYLDIDKQEVKNNEPDTGKLVRKKDEEEGQTASSLPIHFFTIVLNGQPFIRHHIEVFKQLPFKWHWHIIEGVADLKHDTAWSVKLGGRINEQLHRNGLSNDGTTEYIDELVRQYPENITVYRKPKDVFWDGKLEMVNSPLADISEECLLWQVDSDELWSTGQICNGRDMFIAEPDRSAAYYLDQFFVGENLVTTTINTYGNNTGYEWLRTWRFRPGFRWAAHEPPKLCRPVEDNKWVDVATIKPFRHCETKARNLVFQHYAYATEKQLAFKEIYYGYKNAVSQWQHLQLQKNFPVFLKDYFTWVKDDTQLNTIGSQNITPLAWKDNEGQWQFGFSAQAQKQQLAQSSKNPAKILIVRSDAIGDFVIFSGALKYFRKLYPTARIHIIMQQHIAELAQSCPYIDEVITFESRDKILNDRGYAEQIARQLQAYKFDVVINPVYSRDTVGEFLALNSGARELIASVGDDSNISTEKKLANNRFYTKLVPAKNVLMLENKRNEEFLQGLGAVLDEPYMPKVWIQNEDEGFVRGLLNRLRIEIEQAIVVCPFAQAARKHWTIHKWAGLISRYQDYPVIICGTEKDVEKADELKNVADHRNIHNLCGKITLRQLAALLQKSRLCVTADSAPAHIAAAVNCPHVVLLGGGHYGRFMPYSQMTTLVYYPMNCYNCNWKCRHEEAFCITRITVNMVHKGMLDCLNRTNGIRLPANSNGPQYPQSQQDKEIVTNFEAQRYRYLVSAIVSTYNAEELIDKCLQNIENQTIADRLEIIVVNSGSKQNEEAIVREFQKKYDNIKYIKTEKRETVYQAWNRAIEAASGKYITNANTDDRRKADAMEIMVQALENNPTVGLVYGDLAKTYNHNETVDNHTSEKYYWCPDYYEDVFLDLGWCKIGSQPMWRASLHEEIGLFDTNFEITSDYDFLLRVCEKTKCLHIREVLGSFYQSDNTVSHRNILRLNHIENPMARARSYLRKAVVCTNEGKVQQAYEYLDQSFALWPSREGTSQYQILDALTGLDKWKNADTELKFLPSIERWPGSDFVTPRIIEKIFPALSVCDESGILVSVVVDAQNSESFIQGCIENLQRQTIADKLEIIAVIDGKTDQKQESIIRHFQQDHGNIKYIVTEQQETLYRSWNRGIKISRGKYITCVKAADRFTEDALEIMTRTLEHNLNIALVYADRQATNRTDTTDTKECENEKKEFSKRRLLEENYIGSWALWHRDIHKQFGYFDEEFVFAGDYEFWLRVAQGYDFIYINSTLGTYSEAENDNKDEIGFPHSNFEKAMVKMCYQYMQLYTRFIDERGISKNPDFAGFSEINILKKQTAERIRNEQINPVKAVYDWRKTNNLPLLSVIIVTHNRKDKLLQNLSELNRQTEKNFELIVVNNGQPIAELTMPNDKLSYGICYVETKLNYGPSLARNIGAKYSSAKYIAIYDDDAIADINYVKNIICNFNNHNICALRGRVLPSIGDYKPPKHDLGDRECIAAADLEMVVAFNREVFLNIGGFDERLYHGEGCDLSYRIYKSQKRLDCILYFPDVVIYHNNYKSKEALLDKLVRVNTIARVSEINKTEMTAYLHLALNSHPEAIDDLEDKPIKLIYLSTLFQEHFPSHALQYAEKAVSIEPRLIRGRFLLGSLYISFEKYNEAVIMLEPVFESVMQSDEFDEPNTPLESNKTKAECYLSTGTKLAQCYMMQGKYGKVKQVYSNLLNEPLLEIPEQQRANICAVLAKLDKTPPAPVTAAKKNHIPAPVMSEGRYLVSAIVSTYNSEEFLRGCLDDLEQQTIADKLEIIVVNSGSMENEEAIVREYRQKYNNIVYIKTEQREGIYAAWNRAVRIAQGTFVTNANTDDRHRNDALEIMAKTLQENPVISLVYGDQICTDTPNGTFDSHHITEMAKRPEYSQGRLLFGCCVGSQPMWRK
jgi:glycosyltransferase involved in cell wall biosynthesis/ADP-heptose:LPS heptosyltransferase/predicted O-methyltransferase YrrM